MRVYHRLCKYNICHFRLKVFRLVNIIPNQYDHLVGILLGKYHWWNLLKIQHNLVHFLLHFLLLIFELAKDEIQKIWDCCKNNCHVSRYFRWNIFGELLNNAISNFQSSWQNQICTVKWTLYTDILTPYSHTTEKWETFTQVYHRSIKGHTMQAFLVIE